MDDRVLTFVHVSMAKPCGHYDNAKRHRLKHSLSRAMAKDQQPDLGFSPTDL